MIELHPKIDPCKECGGNGCLCNDTLCGPLSLEWNLHCEECDRGSFGKSLLEVIDDWHN